MPKLNLKLLKQASEKGTKVKEALANKTAFTVTPKDEPEQLKKDIKIIIEAITNNKINISEILKISNNFKIYKGSGSGDTSTTQDIADMNKMLGYLNINTLTINNQQNKLYLKTIYNYLMFISSAYYELNSSLSTETELTEDDKNQIFTPILCAALKDLASKNQNLSYTNNSFPTVTDAPNLMDLQLSVCAEEYKPKDPDTPFQDPPFVTYNGAVIFSLTDAQREILQTIDDNLKNDRNVPIDIPLGVGEGKTFLAELITKIYGKPNHGCNLTQEPYGGIIVGGVHVGFSMQNNYDAIKRQINQKHGGGRLQKESNKDLEKEINSIYSKTFPNFTSNNYNPPYYPPAQVDSLSLTDVSEFDLTELTTKIDAIKNQFSKSKSDKKMIIFDEFPHIGYDLRKYIRKMLPADQYTLLFISATPNVESLDIVNPEANDPKTRINNNVYDIYTISVSNQQALQLFTDTYKGKMPVLIKVTTDPEKYYIFGHDQDTLQRTCKAIDFTDPLSTFNLSFTTEVQKVKQDAANINKLKEFIKTNHYHVPLSKSQSLKENREIFFNQFADKDNLSFDHIKIKDISNDTKNLTDSFAENSKDFLENPKSKGNVQLILPDLSPEELQLLAQDLRNNTSKNFEAIFYKHPQDKKIHYLDRDGTDRVVETTYPTIKGKVLMLYSSADAIGGDYGKFSKNVGLQIIQSNSMPSTSKMQQWTARYRKSYPMNELRKECQVVVATRARTPQELIDNMKIEEKKHELLDTLNQLRNNIIATITSAHKVQLTKEQQKHIMLLIRDSQDQTAILKSLNTHLKITLDSQDFQMLITHYKHTLDRLASFRSATEPISGGTKVSQYEIKLRNLLTENDILSKKHIDLYGGTNNNSKIITASTIWDTFNKKRIKCLTEILKKTQQIATGIKNERTEAQKIDISLSQLHTICYSLDAATEISIKRTKDLFVGKTIEKAIEQDLQTIQSKFKQNINDLTTALEEQSQIILKQLENPTPTNANSQNKKSEIKKAFEYLLTLSKYSCFNKQFDVFKNSYIQSLAIKHSIDADVLGGSFQLLLENSNKGYVNSAFFDDTLQELLRQARQIELEIITDLPQKTQQEKEAITKEIEELESKILKLRSDKSLQTAQKELEDLKGKLAGDDKVYHAMQFITTFQDLQNKYKTTFQQLNQANQEVQKAQKNITDLRTSLTDQEKIYKTLETELQQNKDMATKQQEKAQHAAQESAKELQKAIDDKEAIAAKNLQLESDLAITKQTNLNLEQDLSKQKDLATQQNQTIQNKTQLLEEITSEKEQIQQTLQRTKDEAKKLQADLQSKEQELQTALKENKTLTATKTKENEAFQQKIKQLEKNILENQAIAEQKEQTILEKNKQLQISIQEKQKKVNILQATLDENKATLEITKKEVEGLQATLTDKETLAQQKSDEIQEQAQQLEKAVKEQAAALEQARQAQEEAKKAKTEITQLQADLQNKAEALKQATLAYEALAATTTQQEASSQQSLKDALKSQQDAQKTAEEAQQKVQKLQKDLSEKENTANLATQQYHNIQEEVKTLQATLDENTATLETTKEEVKRLKTTLTDTVTLAQQQSEKIQEQAQQLEKAVKEQAAALEQARQAQEEAKKAKTEITQLQADLQNKAEALKQATQAYEALEVTKTQEEAASQQLLKDAALKNQQDAKKTAEQAQQEVQTLQAILDKNKATLETTKKEVEDLQATLKNKEILAQQQSKEIQEKAEQLEEAVKKQAAAQEEVKNAQKEITQLKADLQNKEEALKQATLAATTTQQEASSQQSLKDALKNQQDAQKTAEEAKQEVQKLQKDLSEKENTANLATQQYHNIQEEVKTLQATLNENKITLETTKKEVERLKTTLTDTKILAQQKSDEIQKKAQQLEEAVKEQAEELQTALQGKEATKQPLEEVQKTAAAQENPKLIELNKKHDAAQQLIAALTSQLEQTKKELAAMQQFPAKHFSSTSIPTKKYPITFRATTPQNPKESITTDDKTTILLTMKSKEPEKPPEPTTTKLTKGPYDEVMLADEGSDLQDPNPSTAHIKEVPKNLINQDVLKQEFIHYLESQQKKTIKEKDKTGNKIAFGGLEKRITSNTKRKQRIAELAQHKGNLKRLAAALEFHLDESEKSLELQEKKLNPLINEKTENLKTKTEIYDNVTVTKKSDTKLQVELTNSDNSSNTYEVTNTDQTLTMTTNNPLSTITDKMIVQMLETAKRTIGDTPLEISSLFYEGQDEKEKLQAEAIAQKFEGYAAALNIKCTIKDHGFRAAKPNQDSRKAY